MPDIFFNLNTLEGGIERMLADSVNTNIFYGNEAMLSVVKCDPNSQVSIRSHSQEQWAICLEGSAFRIQDSDEVPFKKDDFWRTSGTGSSLGRKARRSSTPSRCCATDTKRPAADLAFK